ncbi:MAG: hypothetical protein ACMXYG_04355 [Candidatus Woesearchaeota archaeon]
MANIEEKLNKLMESLIDGDYIDSKFFSEIDKLDSEPVLLPQGKCGIFSLGLKKVKEFAELTQNASYKQWLVDRGIEIKYSKTGKYGDERNYGPPSVIVKGKPFYYRFPLDYTSCGRVKDNTRGDKYCFDIFNYENRLLKSAVVVFDSDGNNYNVFCAHSHIDNIPIPLLPNNLVPYLDSKPLSFVDPYWIGNTILGVSVVYSDVSKNKYKIPLRFFLSPTNEVIKAQFHTVPPK